MALKILKEVTSKGQLSKAGCYIQIKPFLPYGMPNDLPKIPCDRFIWASREDFEANMSEQQATIQSLTEVPSAFYLDAATAGDVYQGKNIVYKSLMWANQAVKDQILELNPTWDDKDIEIVDIPKL